MKKIFATLLVGMLAVFSFAAFEVTGGYVNTSLVATSAEDPDGDAVAIEGLDDVTMHGISVGANYLFDGLGIEGGALLVGGSFEYYFEQEFVNNDDFAAGVGTADLTSYDPDTTDEFNFDKTKQTQTNLGLNLGYRQSLNAFFPDLPFGMYVQGLFNYYFGLGDEKVVDNTLGFGGGAGANFTVQNLDMNVGADVLFEKPTLSEDYEEVYESEFHFRPKFKVSVGVQF